MLSQPEATHPGSCNLSRRFNNLTVPSRDMPANLELSMAPLNMNALELGATHLGGAAFA